jgi:hypothetical protein
MCKRAGAKMACGDGTISSRCASPAPSCPQSLSPKARSDGCGAVDAACAAAAGETLAGEVGASAGALSVAAADVLSACAPLVGSVSLALEDRDDGREGGRGGVCGRGGVVGREGIRAAVSDRFWIKSALGNEKRITPGPPKGAVTTTKRAAGARAFERV